MENENILDLNDDDISYMSPDEAKGKIDTFMRSERDNPQGAYFNGNHPDHRKTVEKVQSLYQVASPEPEAQTNAEGEELSGQFSPDFTKAATDALQEYKEKQAARVATAEAEMDILVTKFGYERVDIPDDIQPWQVTCLRIQRMNCEEKFDELRPLLEDQMRRVKLSPELVGAFEMLCRAKDADVQEKQRIIEKMIFSIDEKYDKKENNL